MFFFPPVYLVKPWSARLGKAFDLLAFGKPYHLPERVFAVANDGNIDIDILADARRVNVDVDDLGFRSKCADLTGYPVVKTHPNCKDKVRMRYRHIGLVGAVHPEHPQPVRVGLT